VTNRAIAQARLRNSRLIGRPFGSAQDVVRWFGAVQSQDVTGAFWAVAQRMAPRTTFEDLGRSFDDGQIVRTHALRPTWHFLAPDELRWIEALTGPRVRRANDAVGRRRLGLSRADFDRTNAIIQSALTGGGGSTRDELRARLAEAGVPFRDPNALGHIIMNAELDGLICSGPRRGKQFTYQLVDERIPLARDVTADEARCELTLRYFTSHGPALVHDMAWWSGLTVTDIRRGVELAGDALEQCSIDGKPYVAGSGGFEPARLPEPHVLLLSNYDEYLGSYTDYSPIFDASLPKARTVADVLGVHIVVRDGLVVGGWRRSIGRDRATAIVTLLVPFTDAERSALEAAAEAWARFLGLACELRITTG
jgi:winged helix DNA-binding protein